MYTEDTKEKEKEKEKENIISLTPPKGKREKLKTTLKSNLHKQMIAERAVLLAYKGDTDDFIPSEGNFTSKRKNALNRLVGHKNKKRVISPLRPAQFFRQAHLVSQLSTILQVLFLKFKHARFSMP